MIPKTRLNHQISVPEVRVVNEEGQQVGVMKTSQALELARENGLDLVEIAPQAKPPVVKIIDFAKFKYQQKKALTQAKKNTKKTEVKTLWLTMRIGEHDMQIKAKKVDEFLAEGDMVRIELRMRGREQAFPEIARQNLEKFIKLFTQPYKTEVPIKRLGGTFALTIAPSK
ncbi:MAG: translation initiation factor IF-3 [Candidatus Doudnabacteria bacterium]|nr:translation initiation factor IF-3 [Candidatus Doudnabacteria bacterium]